MKVSRRASARGYGLAQAQKPAAKLRGAYDSLCLSVTLAWKKGLVLRKRDFAPWDLPGWAIGPCLLDCHKHRARASSGGSGMSRLPNRAGCVWREIRDKPAGPCTCVFVNTVVMCAVVQKRKGECTCRAHYLSMKSCATMRESAS